MDNDVIKRLQRELKSSQYWKSSGKLTPYQIEAFVRIVRLAECIFYLSSNGLGRLRLVRAELRGITCRRDCPHYRGPYSAITYARGEFKVERREAVYYCDDYAPGGLLWIEADGSTRETLEGKSLSDLLSLVTEELPVVAIWSRAQAPRLLSA